MRLRNVQAFRSLLALSGKSYRQLEQETSVGDSTISLVATGRQSGLPYDKAVRLCQVLGVEVNVLFTDDIADDTVRTA